METHTVQTEDGYLLDIHRIPNGKGKHQNTNNKNQYFFAEKNTTNINKPVVHLQHALECASDFWLLNLPNQSTGFAFADAGFDVWLGNVRGNRYGRKHVNYTTNDSDFWRFTFDEMQEYDLPAMFNYIQNITNQSKINYIGHSQGTLIMFAKLATEPSFAERVENFFAYAQVTSTTYIKGLLRLLCMTDRGFNVRKHNFHITDIDLLLLNLGYMELESLF